MTTDISKRTDEDRIRASALRQARDIEDRKKLKARVADLVIEAFDLPSRPDADPANPQPSDATLFKQCLAVFQSSDLDDLIYERNVDNRCGYGLCPRPNLKVNRGGEKVWNLKSGKDFKLLDRVELEKWCSRRCQEKTVFVRAQLGKEPAWLRVIRAVDIQLLNEFDSDNLTGAFKALAIAGPSDGNITEKMDSLALERGELNVDSGDNSIDVVERFSDNIPEVPSLTGDQGEDLVDGHRPRKVRFSQT